MFNIRPITESDIEPIVQLSLLAWDAVFISFEQILGSRIFSLVYPDWQAMQRAAIEGVCKDPAKFTTYVAQVDGTIVGFIIYSMDLDKKTGEVEFLAVRSDEQNHGIGTALNQFVLGKMREIGLKYVFVGTGGDQSHAAARRCYEKSGYTGLPLVRYYQDLTE